MIIKEFFYILTAAVIIFSGLEIIWPDLILAYMNINYILLAWFFNAILILTTD
jgi:hypothetical protein